MDLGSFKISLVHVRKKPHYFHATRNFHHVVNVFKRNVIYLFLLIFHLDQVYIAPYLNYCPYNDYMCL